MGSYERWFILQRGIWKVDLRFASRILGLKWSFREVEQARLNLNASSRTVGGALKVCARRLVFRRVTLFTSRQPDDASSREVVRLVSLQLLERDGTDSSVAVVLQLKGVISMEGR